MAATATEGHKIRWFVWAGAGEDRVKIPKQASMRGLWGYDATCSCGWESRTGGATRGSVRRDIENHKWDVEFNAEIAAAGGLIAYLEKNKP